MNTVIRKILTTSMALQFSAGKMSMVFSAITAATVLSIKFHISFLYTLLGCIVVVLLFSFFFIRSGWMGKEFNRVNQLNGLEGILKRIEDRLSRIENEISKK